MLFGVPGLLAFLSVQAWPARVPFVLFMSPFVCWVVEVSFVAPSALSPVSSWAWDSAGPERFEPFEPFVSPLVAVSPLSPLGALWHKLDSEPRSEAIARQQIFNRVV